MASEGPQGIKEKYYGVYLPIYTIYPFAIPLVIYPRCLFISDDLVLFDEMARLEQARAEQVFL